MLQCITRLPWPVKLSLFSICFFRTSLWVNYKFFNSVRIDSIAFSVLLSGRPTLNLKRRIRYRANAIILEKEIIFWNPTIHTLGVFVGKPTQLPIMLYRQQKVKGHLGLWLGYNNLPYHVWMHDTEIGVFSRRSKCMFKYFSRTHHSRIKGCPSIFVGPWTWCDCMQSIIIICPADGVSNFTLCCIWLI